MAQNLTQTHLEVKEVTPLSLSLDILSCLDELNDQEAWLVDLDLDEDDGDDIENLEDDDEDEEHSHGKTPRTGAVPQWVSTLAPVATSGDGKLTVGNNNNNKNNTNNNNNHNSSNSHNNNNNHNNSSGNKTKSEEEKKLELPTIIETIQSIDLVETRKKLTNSISEIKKTESNIDPNAHLLQDLDLSERGHRKTEVDFNNARQEVLKLPQLSGWVTKKSGGKMGQWQKRWLVVRPTHILWSKKTEEIVNPLDVKERRKFQNCVPLLQVNQVSKVNSTRGRKFNVSTIARVYEFRANSKEERDQWVDGLNAHLQALQSTVAFIVGNGLHFKGKQ